MAFFRWFQFGQKWYGGKRDCMMSVFLNRIFLIGIATFLLACSSQAQTLKHSATGETEQLGLLPSIANHQVLVDRARDIEVCDNGQCYSTESQLRISSLLVDGGPSTDVSPRYVLYLSMHNYIEEYAIATSLHQVDYVQTFQSARRSKAGIYEFRYVGINLDGAFGDCFFPEIQAIVDARELSVQVRTGKKTKFFEDASYTDPVYITRTYLGCAEIHRN